MNISPDGSIAFTLLGYDVNMTIAFTWLVMALLAVCSWLVTRNLSSGERRSAFQNVLEAIVLGIDKQIKDVTGRSSGSLLVFLGSLFLFIAVSNLLSVVPGFEAPTGSLSTTAALALCVFVSVPAYGIRHKGLMKYLSAYLKPSPFMLPFNIMGEVSRTLALAVRLFGNVMSGAMIGAILLTIAPLIAPVPMNVLGLLTGLVQAYIFAVLAAVYIGAALSTQENTMHKENAHG
jgi:F-type H+-transporting ATPase subunit a